MCLCKYIFRRLNDCIYFYNDQVLSSWSSNGFIPTVFVPFKSFCTFYHARTCASRGYVIGVGVHMYCAKTKLKLRLKTPVRVNPVTKKSFYSMTTNYPFPIFSPKLKSNLYQESGLKASFPYETITGAKASIIVFYETLKSVPMKKQYLNAHNFAFLLGKDTLNSLI